MHVLVLPDGLWRDGTGFIIYQVVLDPLSQLLSEAEIGSWAGDNFIVANLCLVVETLPPSGSMCNFRTSMGHRAEGENRDVYLFFITRMHNMVGLPTWDDSLRGSKYRLESKHV